MTTEVILTIAGVALFLLVLLAINIRIVPQSKAWVMERLGVYSRTWHTGLHIKLPFIEKAAKKVDLREQILVCGDFNHSQYHSHAKSNSERFRIKSSEEYEQIDEANTMAGAAVITPVGAGAAAGAVAGSTQNAASSKKKEEPYYSLYSWGTHSTPYDRAHNPKSQPVITKDNVSMEIDTVVFYQVTDPKLYAYGHKEPLKAVEHIVATSLRNIVGGLELDETLTARDKINMGIRKSLDEVSDAWGIKITRVEIRNIIISDVELAEAMEKQMIAEREKRAKILKAEGESKSTLLIAQAKADAIRLVNEAKPSKEFLTIRALEAYEVASHGQATKIIVPSEIQSLAGLALSGSEVFKEGEKMEAPHVDIVD